MFHAVARLDLPTFDDPAVQKQLEQTSAVDSGSTVAWGTVNAIVNIFSTAVQLVSQLVVLIRVVYDQPDGPLIAILSFGQALFQNEGRHSRTINTSGRFFHHQCFAHNTNYTLLSMGRHDQR